MSKAKIVLRGKDGMTEHAQGTVHAEYYSDIQLVEHSDHIYLYKTFYIENGMLVMLFDETNYPKHIVEF